MNVIDEYFKEIRAAERTELERIRNIIKTTVPEVEELVLYGVPTFNYKGKHLISFSIFKNHMSLFPTAKPINSMKPKLNNFKLSKASIQFNLNNTIPGPLIRNLLIYRIEEIDKITA